MHPKFIEEIGGLKCRMEDPNSFYLEGFCELKSKMFHLSLSLQGGDFFFQGLKIHWFGKESFGA
jgi:hypothetical protein